MPTGAVRNLFAIFLLVCTVGSAQAVPLPFDTENIFVGIYTSNLMLRDSMIEDNFKDGEITKNIRDSKKKEYAKHVTDFQIIYSSYILAKNAKEIGLSIECLKNDTCEKEKFYGTYVASMIMAEIMMVKLTKEILDYQKSGVLEGLDVNDVRIFLAYKAVENSLTDILKIKLGELDSTQLKGYLTVRLFADKTIEDITRLSYCPDSQENWCKDVISDFSKYLAQVEEDFKQDFMLASKLKIQFEPIMQTKMAN